MFITVIIIIINCYILLLLLLLLTVTIVIVVSLWALFRYDCLSCQSAGIFFRAAARKLNNAESPDPSHGAGS